METNTAGGKTSKQPRTKQKGREPLMSQLTRETGRRTKKIWKSRPVDTQKRNTVGYVTEGDSGKGNPGLGAET